MCECGCYMNDHSYWLPAPDGGRYVITIATPCEECETPAGVIVRLAKPFEFADMDAGYAERLDLKRDAAFPIVYPHKLFARFMRLISHMFGVKDYYAIPDEIWNKLNAFDPDETKRTLFEIIGRQIRVGARNAKKGPSDD
jgi:hypothetical protein